MPSGYAIGNCLNGVHLDRTWKDFAAGLYWDGGFVHGNYNGCGWIDSNYSNLLYGQTNTACGSSASHGLSEFMYYENGHYIINDATKTDGTPLDNIRDCTEYANYRPWSSNNAETDAIRTIPAHSFTNGQPRLWWRYLTKYQSTLGTGYFYMVRDTAAPPGNGDWVFVAQSCFF
jgi:hypothetical protein